MHPSAPKAVDMSVKAFVASLRIPPNFTIEVLTDRIDGSEMIRIEARWDDMYQPSSTARTGTQVRVDPVMPTECLEHLIYEQLRLLWLHELHEWFTIGGRHHIDPHPPEGGLR